jgi:hypothetical protein
VTKQMSLSLYTITVDCTVQEPGYAFWWMQGVGKREGRNPPLTGGFHRGINHLHQNSLTSFL